MSHRLDRDDHTIFALSSGGLPSGVAVVRISGPNAFLAAERLIGERPHIGRVRLASFWDDEGSIVDRGLVIGFSRPRSFTGEDVVEFQCHGSVAVVNRILDLLGMIPGCRPAERGEFSLRAFLNGKMDLTALEGLGDLIDSETEQQRRLALDAERGALFTLYDGWQREIDQIRARLEADLDFSDEGDVSEAVSDPWAAKVSALLVAMKAHAATAKVGEIIRNGFRVALVGPPNAGKSSLLNALAKRDVAIVTEIAGTTRDTLDVALDLDGYKVVVTDTAGLRETDDPVERIGVERAEAAARDADLVVLLQAIDADEEASLPPGVREENCLTVLSKADLVGKRLNEGALAVSSVTPGGLDAFLAALTARVKSATAITVVEPLMVRPRYETALRSAMNALEGLDHIPDDLPELAAEQLREASSAIGRITGETDPEAILDEVFSSFCIGK